MRSLPHIVSLLSLLLSLVLAVPAPPVRAQTRSVANRTLGVVWNAGTPRLSFSARDLATPALTQKLRSGLPQTLSMRIYAYVDRVRDPVAVAAVSCRVAYDLWEEVYRVQIQSEQADRAVIARSLQEVHELCLVVRQRSIGRMEDYARLSGRSVYFAVVVEQNPISRDTVERIRRWLSRPSAGSSLGGEAFFGSFVSIFVNRQMGTAERVVQFRSPTHVVP